MFMDLPLTLQPKESVCGLVGESSPPLPLSPLPPSLSTCRDIGKCLPGLLLCSGWSVGSPGNKPQSWFLFTVAMTTVGGVWGDGNYGLVLFKV